MKIQPPNRPPLSFTYFGLFTYGVLSLTSMALMSIGAGILLLSLFVDFRGPRGFFRKICEFCRPRPVRLYLWASIVVTLVCVVSLLGAQWAPLSYAGQFTKVNWNSDLAKLWYLYWPLVLGVSWIRLTEIQKAGVLKAWFVTFGVISLVGVLQFWTGWPRSQSNPVLPGYYHPVLFLGHHLSVASVWIIPFFAALEFSFRKPSKKPLFLPRWFFITSAALGLAVLVLGYSRTLWVGLPIALILWALLQFPLRSAVLAIVLTILTGLAVSQTSFVERRFQNLMGVSDRIELWRANIEFFKKRPLFGIGFQKNQELVAYYFQEKHPHRFQFVGHSHNQYLEILAGLGLAGVAAWLLWLVSAVWPLWLTLSKMGGQGLYFPLALGSAWVLLLINGLTQVNIWEGKVFHQVAWMIGLGLSWVFVQARLAKK